MFYQNLAFFYDALMSKMDYESYADYLLKTSNNPTRILDLACGTGRLTEILCDKGCDIIAVDSSAEMLSVAQNREYNGLHSPLFLLQNMSKLDLYGTVEAVFCTIDALNYITDESDFLEAIRRVRLFLEPGGYFIFDMLTPKALAARDGAVFMSDAKDVYCTWRCSFKNPFCHQEVTFFSKQANGLWERGDERHIERAYSEEFVKGALLDAGFLEVTTEDMFDSASTRDDDERVVFVAK